MTPESSEFKTIRITPASMTRRKKFERRRAQELAAIEADGWEIVDVEPERIFRRGDKVTVRRVAAPTDEPMAVSTSWWDSLDDRQKVGIGMCAIAVVVLILGLGTMV